MIASSDNLAQFGAAFAQALFNGLWIGIVVALCVYAFISLNRGFNAASRHAAWYAALIVIALMPVVSFAVSLSKIDVSAAPVESTTIQAVAPETAAVGPFLPSTQTQTAPLTAPSLLSIVSQPIVLERASIAVAVTLAGIAATRIAFLLAGLFGLARVKRASRIVDPSLAPSLARTMARDNRARAVHVRISETLDAPAAAGFRTPAILLPADLVDSLDAGALDQVAMHEYAHLRRYDDWTNLAHRFIERLFWFNPAIWFVSGRIDLEREIACDDWAVAGAEGVTGYADCLWHLARDGRVPAFAATAPGAFLTRNQIAARIEHLLERHRDGAPSVKTAKLLSMAPVLAAALALVVGRAPAIAVPVQPDAAAASIAAAAAGVAHVTHATVAVHMVAITNVPDAPHAANAQAPSSASKSKSDCPLTKKASTVSAVSKAAVAKAVSLAMVSKQVTIQRRVESAVTAAMTAENASIRQTVHRVMQEHQHVIGSAIRAHANSIMAAAAETDNLSYGPNDRNLLAHCTGCDLSGKDLRNADLHGITLTGDDLSGADLRGANLRSTVLTGVDLSNARLDGADLRNAVFTGSDIDGATFAGAKTDGIRLVGMQLTNSILVGTSARAILGACAGCDLSDLDLHGRDLHGITFDGADMHGTDLRGANLEGTRFNGVDLSGVKFDGANLRHAEFNGCDLQGVDFTHAQTQGIQLQGSSLGNDSTE